MQSLRIKDTTFTNGPLLIIIAALLWALDGVLRRGLYGYPPIGIIFIEHLIGFAILLPFVFKHFKKTTLTRKDWGIMALVSLFSGLLGTLFFTAALLKTAFISFSVVFFLQKLQPLFAIGTAHIFLKEPIHKKYLVYAGLALVAAFYLTFPMGRINFETGSGTAVAGLLAFLAAACWGSSTTFSKMMLTDKNPQVVTFLRFAMTTVLAFLAIILVGKQETALRFPETTELWRFLVIALSTGMVALLIYYKGLKNTPVRVATILELMFPLVAVLIDLFVYNTTLHPTQYVAGALLIMAMYQIGKYHDAYAV